MNTKLCASLVQLLNFEKECRFNLLGTITYLPSPCPLVRLAAARRLSVVAAAACGGGSCWQLLLLWL